MPALVIRFVDWRSTTVPVPAAVGVLLDDATRGQVWHAGEARWVDPPPRVTTAWLVPLRPYATAGPLRSTYRGEVPPAALVAVPVGAITATAYDLANTSGSLDEATIFRYGVERS